jgi:ferredoxin-NADP reductase
MSAITATAIPRPLPAWARRLADSPWLRPFNDVAAIDELLETIDPQWSLRRIKARVVRIVEETHDTRSLVLQPNWRWPGFRAGQHAVVEVVIDGVRHRRCYSLSSPPGGRRIAITVKRQPEGKVSSWLHSRIRVGDVLTLSAPGGGFVLPDPVPRKLLMISGGSGITPLMSMLRDLHARDYDGSIVFLHVCRSSTEDAIFGHELCQLAARWKSLQLQYHDSRARGRFDAEALQRCVPDLAERHTLLCGPAGLMAMVQALWQDEAIAQPLQSERFSLVPALLPASPPSEATANAEVTCITSGRRFQAGPGPLLQEAEAAGLAPKHGCRMGICHSCQCRKVSGTVQNLLTGAISAEPDEPIQLCISAARSDLTLAL